jgi:hypothetical protein
MAMTCRITASRGVTTLDSKRISAVLAPRKAGAHGETNLNAERYSL